MYKVLALFIILILGLLLCSFLGGNCLSEGFQTSSSSPKKSISTTTGVKGITTVDIKGKNKNYTMSDVKHNDSSFDNYNHYTKESYPSIFYGPNGSTAKIVKTNGAYTLVVAGVNGNTKVYVVASNSMHPLSITKNIYYGPNGGNAVVTTDNNGNYIINVVKPDGSFSVYTVQNMQHTLPPASGNIVDNNSNKNKYNKSLPDGIPGNMIPPGQKDLYILKSQVVPPVCPACPVQPASCPREAKCPPCPACERCPEPSFECKKVPNYSEASAEMGGGIPGLNNSQTTSGMGGGIPGLNNSQTFGGGIPGLNNSQTFGGGIPGLNNSQTFGGMGGSSNVMPVPVLSSFSTFGM